jgi:hypothetical protein
MSPVADYLTAHGSPAAKLKMRLMTEMSCVVCFEPVQGTDYGLSLCQMPICRQCYTDAQDPAFPRGECAPNLCGCETVDHKFVFADTPMLCNCGNDGVGFVKYYNHFAFQCPACQDVANTTFNFPIRMLKAEQLLRFSKVNSSDILEKLASTVSIYVAALNYVCDDVYWTYDQEVLRETIKSYEEYLYMFVASPVVIPRLDLEIIRCHHVSSAELPDFVENEFGVIHSTVHDLTPEIAAKKLASEFSFSTTYSEVVIDRMFTDAVKSGDGEMVKHLIYKSLSAKFAPGSWKNEANCRIKHGLYAKWDQLVSRSSSGKVIAAHHFMQNNNLISFDSCPCNNCTPLYQPL